MDFAERAPVDNPVMRVAPARTVNFRRVILMGERLDGVLRADPPEVRPSMSGRPADELFSSVESLAPPTYNQSFTSYMNCQPMKEALQVKVEPHEFSGRDFIGGDAALDFINTVTGRDQAPRDWLDGYDRLIDWAMQADLVSTRVLRELSKMSHAKPGAAGVALERAKVLREVLFGLVGDVASGKKPSPGALALLNDYWLKGNQAHRLGFSKGCLVAELREEAIDLDLIASMVAYRMVRDVLPIPTDRLRMCAGPNCSWLFIDSSKAGRRRWCDMNVCGNVAKSRRFQERSRR